MYTKKARNHITNPILGILPFVLYIILHAYVLEEKYALSISLATAILSEFALRKFFKSRIQGVTFYITSMALILTALLWMFGNSFIKYSNTYILFAEMMIIIQFMILRLSKTFISTKLFKEKTFLDKAILSDFFYTATLVQYLLTVHVFAILLYKQITDGFFYEMVDHVIYITIPIILVLALGIYHMFRINSIVSKLVQEEWLPIVTENGEVTGRIAKSVSVNMKNKFLHPIIRIALICKDKVYLQERSEESILDPKKLDYPFEKYMLFKHDINLAAHNSIKRIVGKDVNVDPDFVFKYIFENEITKRLIFFFTISIDDESKVRKTENMTGKFWTVKQIDEQFGDQIFSECFELEYEYLKHMILLNDGDKLLAKE